MSSSPGICPSRLALTSPDCVVYILGLSHVEWRHYTGVCGDLLRQGQKIPAHIYLLAARSVGAERRHWWKPTNGHTSDITEFKRVKAMWKRLESRVHSSFYRYCGRELIWFHLRACAHLSVCSFLSHRVTHSESFACQY